MLWGGEGEESCALGVIGHCFRHSALGMVMRQFGVGRIKLQTFLNSWTEGLFLILLGFKSDCRARAAGHHFVAPRTLKMEGNWRSKWKSKCERKGEREREAGWWVVGKGVERQRKKEYEGPRPQAVFEAVRSIPWIYSHEVIFFFPPLKPPFFWSLETN